MATKKKTVVSDLRGAVKIAVDATVGTTDLVERMHRTIQALPAPVGKAPPAQSTTGITGLVYRSVRGSTRLVGKGIDASLAALEKLLPETGSGPRREAFMSALNGTHGDHLARTANPLAIEMGLRHQGRAIDATQPAASLLAAGGGVPTGKLLILVHGLCMNDLQWQRDGHDHGAALAEEFGYTALYLRYNSGLHIGDNGRTLSTLLETLIQHWPCPLQEFTLLGHSMGGLLARSACFQAAGQGQQWLQQLSRLVCLGTPHHGSPLERGGKKIDQVLELSPYSAPLALLGKSRSAGIQDLRHGAITHGGPDFVPLPLGVECFAAAATLGAKRNLLAERLLGDGLVPLNSALGLHKDAARTLAFANSHQWIGYEMGHLELLSRPEVYAQLRAWLKTAD